MDMRQLHYFVTVVEQQTFTEAAVALHISQPSLSIAIKKFEEQIGFTLVDRSRRKLTVTKEGERVYLEAKKLLTHVKYVSQEMMRLKSHGPPELSLGIIESVKSWIPKILLSFRKEFKDVRIHLHEILSLQDVEKALTHFTIYLAITNQYIQNKEIAMLPIYEERLVALLPPKHRLKDEEFVTIKDLKQDDFIISREGFQTREDILHAFRKQGITPNIQFEIERFETASSLVKDGLGVTLVPENYVTHTEQHAYHIKHIQSADISRPVYVAYMKHRYVPPIVEAFITLVHTYFQTSSTIKTSQITDMK